MNAFNRSEIGALMQGREIEPALLLPTELLDVIMERRFGSSYHPIVDVQSGELLGYQASANFWTRDYQPLPIEGMQDSLRSNPLLQFHLELQTKQQQISRFPGSGWLMLDLDLDSFFAGGDDQRNPFLSMFREHAWSDRELMINIIEQPGHADAYRSQQMMALLQQSGTAVALEDIGIRWGMFSLSAFMDASVIKFSSLSLRSLDMKAAQATVEWLVSAARKLGVQTIMSNVDSCAALDWARRMGIDCVQGSLFAKQKLQAR